MGKVCVVGAFRLGSIPKGGQEIKTIILADTIENKCGKIYRIDTLSHYSRFKMPFQLIKAMMSCKNIIILPAHNGVTVLSSILTKLNCIFRRKLHYSVIGGWLQDLLPKRPSTAKALKKFDGIYVETQTMKEALEKQGFKNVIVVPNCKPLKILEPNEINKEKAYPLRLVTFSRVTEKKGIGTAVKFVNLLNAKYGKTIFTLDIYGPINDVDLPWFNELQKSFTPSIIYKGNASYDNTVDILSDYYALLFPTKYFTEGIPGSIIDAYAAGLPVIASKWKSYNDVVADGITGLGYEFDNEDDFLKLMMNIAENPGIINGLRQNCLVRARDFLPDNALKPLMERIK